MGGKDSSRLFFLLASLALASCVSGRALALGEDSKGTLGIFAGRDPRVFYAAETEEPVLALTIDDAPDPDTTPALLELLAKHRVRATFFVIASQIPGNELLLLDLVSAGHEVGNHMAHDRRSVRLSAKTFERQLLNTKRMLEPFGGNRWFRPGSGYYDDEMLDLLERHGYRAALGTVYPLDPHIPSSRLATRWILWRSKPGAVIILHDRGNRGRRTLKTLERVLPRLIGEGYRFVTLSELEKLDQRRERNAEGPDAAPGREAP